MSRTSHDQLFKQVIEAFFADFMWLFDPDTAAELDFSTLTFRDAEVFTDLPQGERRTADIVAEVQTLSGEPRLIVIHVEIQREREPGFDARMWEYYVTLRLCENKPVLPIALVFYAGREAIAYEEYAETLFGRTIVTFRYLQISLPLLAAEEYVRAERALGAGLASVMRLPGERAGQIALHLAGLRRILDAEQAGEVDPARAFLLGNLIETYLPLSVEERAELQVQLQQEGNMTVDISELTWADQIDLRASLRVRREYIRRLFQIRYGRVVPEIEALIAGAETEEDLDALLDRTTAGIRWEDQIDLQASLQVKRDAIRRVVHRRFGRVTPEVEAVIVAADSEGDLDALLDRAIDARSEDEVAGTPDAY